MATASELLAVAVKQIGVKESPPDSNNVRYNTWYYGREVSGKAYPWCMVFVQWCCAQAGVKLPARTASCWGLKKAALGSKQWVSRDYRPGDIVIYDFDRDGTTDHCGIIESIYDSDTVIAIEGNTSAAGSQSDGGMVCRKSRKLTQIVGAVRPPYEEENVKKEVETVEKRYDKLADCPTWAQATVKKLMDKGYLNGDGTGLDLSHDMVRLLVILDRAKAFD